MANNRGGSRIGGQLAVHLGNLLDLIKTVHGSGSGIDADTVDTRHVDDTKTDTTALWTAGKINTQFATAIRRLSAPASSDCNSFTDYNGFFTWNTANGTFNNTPKGNLTSGAGYIFMVQNFTYDSSTSYILQECIFFTTSGAIIDRYFRSYSGSTWSTWNKIWHDGNMGSGSGLNADKLDGLDSLAFMKADGSVQATGGITFSSTATTNVSDTTPTGLSYGKLQSNGTFSVLADTDGSQTEYLYLSSGYSSGAAGNGLAIGYNTLTWKNNTIWHAGNMGTNSTLDADKLDGVHAGGLSGTAGVDWTNSYIPVVKPDGSIELGKYIDLHDSSADTNDYTNRITSSGTGVVQINGYKIWHEGNDGSNSKLDADTVDGFEASSLLKYAGFVTANTGSTSANQYTKIFSWSITAQNAECNVVFDLLGVGQGTTPVGKGRLYIRFKQQAAMGSAPIVEMTITDNDVFDATSFIGVVTINTTSQTTIELYAKIPIANCTLTYNPLITSGSGMSFYESQSFLSSLPAGNTIACGYLSINHALSINGNTSITGNMSATGNISAVNATLTGDITMTRTKLLKSSDNTGTIGFGLFGSVDTGMADSSKTLSFSSGNTIYIKHNNWNDGTKDIFYTANTALQLYTSGAVLQLRTSTGTPTAGGTITWGTTYKVLHEGMYGHGNGINADKLDSLEASSFLRSDSDSTGTGKYTFNNTSWDNTNGASTGFVIKNSASVGAAISLVPLSSAVTDGTKGWSLYAGSTGSDIGDGSIGLWAHVPSGSGARFKVGRDGEGYLGVGANNKIWHAGNDGHNSTLDADTVDTLHASDLLKSDVNSEQVVSGSEIRVQSTNSTERFGIEFNETEGCLDFIYYTA